MSRNRVHRLFSLIALLSSGRSFTLDDLAAKLSVSRRTLFRDMKKLSLAGVPYHYDAAGRTYTLDASFYLPSLNLSLDEVTALLLIVRRFASGQSLPVHDSSVRAAEKIEHALAPEIRELCRSMVEGVTVNLPPLVDAGRIENVFRELQRALAERRNVHIEYDSYFEGQTVDTVVSPYHMVFVNRAWYLIGYSSLHTEVRTFKLDRITSLVDLEERFDPDPEFDIEAHFGLAWSMIPEGKVYHVRLRFLPKVAGNMEEISWHKTQQVTARPDGSCIFEADVDGLREITWWILGYGDQVVIEEPPELRDRIGQIASRMCELAAGGPEPPESD